MSVQSALLLLEEEMPGPSASSGEALHVFDNVNHPITSSQWDSRLHRLFLSSTYGRLYLSARILFFCSTARSTYGGTTV
jgi:hypothetical protein